MPKPTFYGKILLFFQGKSHQAPDLAQNINEILSHGEQEFATEVKKFLRNYQHMLNAWSINALKEFTNPNYKNKTLEEKINFLHEATKENVYDNYNDQSIKSVLEAAKSAYLTTQKGLREIREEQEIGSSLDIGY